MAGVGQFFKLREMISIINCLHKLSEDRPIFHSEADFQFSFAWKIHEIYRDEKYYLEYPINYNNSDKHIDLVINSSELSYAIELKYKTRTHSAIFNNENYELKDQSAHDIGKYDFIKDIKKLEDYVQSNNHFVGYAIFLTNDSTYWKEPQKKNAVADAFHINEGRILKGELGWSAEASKGTKKGREESLKLKGEYLIHWNEYSIIGVSRYNQFKFVLLEINKQKIAQHVAAGD